MKRRFGLLCGLLACTALRGQVEQLATSGNGEILLMHTRFKLQSETNLGPAGRIYRWQNGEWSLVAAAKEIGFAISPPDFFEPFISTDARVVGWQVNVGCILCQIIIGPPLSSEVSGVTLPSGFARGTLRMSRNGRYFTADSYPFTGAQYLDSATGEISDVPVNLFARPVVREIANDGTALLLITHGDDLQQLQAPGTLSLWKPREDPRPIYSENRAQSPTISATGRRVAFEAVVEGGPNDDQRTLVVLDTQTGEQIPVAAMPPKDFRAAVESFAKPVWDSSGTKLVYRSFDDRGQPAAIAMWEGGTRESRVLLTSDEGFKEAVLSDDGGIVWAVTATNRLLRLDVSTGESEGILSPIGSLTSGTIADAVPGSALLIPGLGFTASQKALDGDVQFPLVDVNAQGLWVQIPWEYASVPEGTRSLAIRSDDNPFELVVNSRLTHRVEPWIATWRDPGTGIDYAKAAHADFSSLVTPSSPARPGETVHVYLTGLGPLDHPLATGAPGPADPLLHPVTPLICRLADSPQPLEMPYLGYAVGMIGIYQADITIPDHPPDGTSTLLCTATTADGTFSGTGALATTSSR